RRRGNIPSDRQGWTHTNNLPTEKMNLVHCATRASCATRSDNHKGFYRRHTDVRLVEVNKLDRK
ncbi:MAG: hypothetical protein QF732_11210, partial [Nitrospinaceae bacterium]|nr:hypothetical protein [Nitrospinaceae bacterium]